MKWNAVFYQMMSRLESIKPVMKTTLQKEIEEIKQRDKEARIEKVARAKSIFKNRKRKKCSLNFSSIKEMIHKN